MTRIQKQNHDPDLKKDANSTEDISDFNKNGHHDKIDLYLSLFRGRDDVYARRWVSRKTGRTGYSPALQDHAFENGRPKEVLSPDDYRPFTKVDFIENHLQGDRAIGVYPLLNDNTTWFLAFEFDGERAFMEAEELQGVCEMQSIPAYLEKSRSGNFHVWIFFTTPIPAWKARRVGLELLKEAGVVGEERQSERQAFDRMFPNQDRLSGKGFGNLIALPLQE